MGTGMALLAKLRAQQRPNPSTNSCTDKGNELDSSGGIPTPPSCWVDICTAVDCVGSGGGACFLEIEELVRELQTINGCPNIQARRVGCLLNCDKGPNVAVTSCAASSSTGTVHQPQHREMHSRVVGPDKCSQVVADVRGRFKLQDPIFVDPNNMRYKMLSRRAAGMRWESLIMLSRKDGAVKGAELLESANKAEMAAASYGGDACKSRASRRAARLLEASKAPVEEPFPSLGPDGDRNASGTNSQPNVTYFEPGSAAEFRMQYAKQFQHIR